MVKGKNKEKTKALVLFSGGLDSRLVIKILQDQKNPKLEVIALMFKLPFGGVVVIMNNVVLDFLNYKEQN